MVFSGFFEEPKQRRARPRFTKEDKLPFYKAQGERCNGCKRKLPIDLLDVDHKNKAFAKGGTDKPRNLQLLCGTCNGKKGTKTQAQFEKQLAVEKGKKKPASAKKTPAAKKTTAKPAARKKGAKRNNDPFADLFGF